MLKWSNYCVSEMISPFNEKIEINQWLPSLEVEELVLMSEQFMLGIH